jgi:hypothetical protein
LPPPHEDEEDVLHCRKAAGTPVSTVLLGLILLRDDAAVVLIEHVALLEGVVDRGLVVWAWILQHVIKHTGASRSRSRASSSSSSRPCTRASRQGFLPFLPHLCFCWGYLDLHPSTGVLSTRLPSLSSQMAPIASSSEVMLVAMPNSSLESTGGLCRAHAQGPDRLSPRRRRALSVF